MERMMVTDLKNTITSSLFKVRARYNDQRWSIVNCCL
jgi:hypothetical protein